MSGTGKRVDLVERAAAKLDRNNGGSLVEKAVERLASTASGPSPGPSPGSPRGPSSGGRPGAGAPSIGSAPAPDLPSLEIPLEALGDPRVAPAGVPPGVSQGVPGREAGPPFAIDLIKLQLAGYVTPNCEPTRTAEEFRVLKRPLLIKAFGAGARRVPNGHLVMITSARPNEGKTFTAVNLSMSIASEPDLHVLLVDSDVHKLGLRDVLGITADKGLVDLLVDDGLDLADVLIKTNIPNLTVLPAGSSLPQATELLASQRMVDLARELANRYPNRVIIFDAPPVLASSEPAALAMHVGQIVVVVEAARTNHRAVQETLALISACQNISFVLNKTSFSAGSDRFGSYSYYGYGDK